MPQKFRALSPFLIRLFKLAMTHGIHGAVNSDKHVTLVPVLLNFSGEQCPDASLNHFGRHLDLWDARFLVAGLSGRKVAGASFYKDIRP